MPKAWFTFSVQHDYTLKMFHRNDEKSTLNITNNSRLEDLATKLQFAGTIS